jgi:hypothetical protein
MANSSDPELKWWHKAALWFFVALCFVQVKSCMSGNARLSNNHNATGQMLQSLGLARRDACSYIIGMQYPYDWKDSNLGACVKKLPPRAQTIMVPDPFEGLFQVPQTVMNNNIWAISSPVGDGIGEFNGDYLVGIISTSHGEAEFVCAGVDKTGTSRGICSLR